MIAFIVSHESMLAALAISVIDLVFAINPSTESSGILHWILGFLGSIAKPIK